jgi:putative chitinase
VRIHEFVDSEINEDWRKIAAAASVAGALGLGGDATKPTAQSPMHKEVAPMQIGSKLPPTVDPRLIQRAISILKNPYVQILKATAEKRGIHGIELAAFLAQCAHESSNFSSMEEQGTHKRFLHYDLRRNPKMARILGNIHRGDGYRYRGRGFIQLTGRDNYQRAGDALNLPLVSQPDLLLDPRIAAEVAIWFWQNRVANRVNDFSDTSAVTKHINSSLSGLDDRDEKFQAFKMALRFS